MPGYILEGIAQGAGDAFAQALRDRNERRRAAIEAAAREQQRQTARSERLEDFEKQLELRESFKVEGEKREGKAAARTRQEGLGAVGQIFDIGEGVTPQERQQQLVSIMGRISPEAGEFVRKAVPDYLKMFEDDDPEIDSILLRAGFEPTAEGAEQFRTFKGLERQASLAAKRRSGIKVEKEKIPKHITIDKEVLNEEDAISNYNTFMNELEGTDKEEGLRQEYEQVEVTEGYLGTRVGRVTTEDKEIARKELNEHITKINKYAAGLRKFGIEVQDVEEIPLSQAWETWKDQLDTEEREALERAIELSDGKITWKMAFDKYGNQ